jgi:hypothetical protein
MGICYYSQVITVIEEKQKIFSNCPLSSRVEVERGNIKIVCLCMCGLTKCLTLYHRRLISCARIGTSLWIIFTYKLRAKQAGVRTVMSVNVPHLCE